VTLNRNSGDMARILDDPKIGFSGAARLPVQNGKGAENPALGRK
jgi:hypothetical protein